MTLETHIKAALHAQAATVTLRPDLGARVLRAGRRARRFRTATGCALLALIASGTVALTLKPGSKHDSLVIPATQAPTLEPSISPPPNADPEASDREVGEWLRSLPLGKTPEVAWTYGLTFHAPGLDYTFRAGGWLVPLGRGGRGYVVELHSEGDTGAGDADKRTGVLTASGLRQIDHGDLTHGLSADGRLLASSLFEATPADAPTGFELFDTATGRRSAHVDFKYLSSQVVSVTASEVVLRVLRDSTAPERLVAWDVRQGTVRDRGSASSVPDQEVRVRDRPFSFAAGKLHELSGQQRVLDVHAPAALTVMDAVREAPDSVLLVVGGQNNGDLALLRCRFSTQSCERTTTLGADRKADFALDHSLR